MKINSPVQDDEESLKIEQTIVRRRSSGTQKQLSLVVKEVLKNDQLAGVEHQQSRPRSGRPKIQSSIP